MILSLKAHLEFLRYSAVILAIVFGGQVGTDKPDKPAPMMNDIQKKVVTEFNKWRLQHGKPAMKPDERLMATAQSRAGVIRRQGHQANGRWPWDDARVHGFPGFTTEDLAFADKPDQAYSPAEVIHDLALPEPTLDDGHKRQMLGQFNMDGKWHDYKFNRIGVGVFGNSYCLMFGREEEQTGSTQQ